MHFCTIINEPFLLQGLALWHSLQRFKVPFPLWVLCADDASYALLNDLDLPLVEPVALAEVEAHCSALRAIKEKRSAYEYIATLKPYFVAFILETEPDVDLLASADADLFFFASPEAVERELGDGSVLLTRHNFSPHLSHLFDHGQYNGGFVAFRRDSNGLAAATWWCEQVFEWCSDRVEGGRRSNQKYLEEFPSRFRSVYIARHTGMNVAPWNVDANPVALRGGTVYAGDNPLIFYHFHHLRFIRPWLLDSSLALYRSRANGVLKRRVYAPYIRDLFETQRWLIQEHGYRAELGTVRYAKDTAGFDPLLALSRIRKRQWFVAINGRIV